MTDEKKVPPVLTCVEGTNADLIPDVMRLYVPEGGKVLDMTYGRGVFWKKIPDDAYDLTKNDLSPDLGDTTYDFSELPDEWEGLYDAVVLDPPYLYVGGWKTFKNSVDSGYRNRERANSGIHGVAAVHQLYARGYLEAYRVLKRKGIFMVKCMDQVMSGKQTWMHLEMQRLGEILGFKTKDQFILKSPVTPLMRHKTQKHARRNHSYLLVFTK